MRTTCFAVVLLASAIFGGCGRSDPPPQRSHTPPKTPSVAEYQELLERRVKSSGGADINVMKECSLYKNSSDEKKRELYETAKSLMN